MADEKGFPQEEDGYAIAWEVWVDAYNHEEIEVSRQQYMQNIEDLAEEFDDEGIIDEQFYTQPYKTIMTPFGILPLTEHSLASNHFKLWVGHTNFKLLQSSVDIIEGCDGVETVDIMTPYRFRLGIAKMFKDRDVMNGVKEALIAAIPD